MKKLVQVEVRYCDLCGRPVGQGSYGVIDPNGKEMDICMLPVPKGHLTCIEKYRMKKLLDSADVGFEERF